MRTLVVLLILFPAIVFVPGFLVLRRRSLSDELRLTLSIVVSLLLVGAATFALFLLGAGHIAFVGASVAVVAATVVARRTLAAFLRTPIVSAWLRHYAILLGWLLILCLITRNFSGDGWAGDWEEHYQRAGVFCGQVPADAPLTGGWSLPARPPFQNLVTAFFLQDVGYGFAAYQLTTLLLSSLVFFGAASLWSALAGGLSPGLRAGLLPLTALLCLNPSVIQNATYPWTRSLTNFLVLQGLALFWLAVRDSAPALRRWAYLLLGLAALTHYSAAPYVIALFLVEAALVVTHRASLRAALGNAALLALPLAPWLLFAVHHFGMAGTFLSNSSFRDTAALDGRANAAKLLGNVVSTLIPYPLRGVPALDDQADVYDYVRDYAFLLYQVSLPFMIGSVGAIVVSWRLLRHAAMLVRGGRFRRVLAIAAFVLAAFLIGIASVGEPDRYGVGHVCLQPLAMAALVYLAVQWPSLFPLERAALRVGLGVDAAFGIALHFWMRHLRLEDVTGAAARAVSANFLSNLQRKADVQFTFVGDLPWSGAVIALLAVVTIALAWRVAAAPVDPGSIDAKG
jgi:hypothetical protein